MDERKEGKKERRAYLKVCGYLSRDDTRHDSLKESKEINVRGGIEVKDRK